MLHIKGTPPCVSKHHSSLVSPLSPTTCLQGLSIASPAILPAKLPALEIPFFSPLAFFLPLRCSVCATFLAYSLLPSLPLRDKSRRSLPSSLPRYQTNSSTCFKSGHNRRTMIRELSPNCHFLCLPPHLTSL